MSNVELVSLEVQADFLAKQTKAKPSAALAEIVWNGLDADATNVNVEVVRGDLSGGVSKIIIYDDGSGFSREEARVLFGNLGGSWKRQTRQTKQYRRQVHGQEGKGRYKAFALGKSVKWNVCYRDDRGVHEFEIDVLDADLKRVLINEERPAKSRATGVIVTISDAARGLTTFPSENDFQELAEVFALHLMNYTDIKVSIGERLIDPSAAIVTKAQRDLAFIVDADGKEHAAELEIVEWKSETKRTLYLCSEAGFPLDQVETRFHVPGFAFSAYLKSSFLTQMHNDGRTGLAELEPVLKPVVEQARETIKDYFRERAAEQAKSVVQTWRAQNVYPYDGDPQTVVEKVERQVFDIIAVNVERISPEIGDVPKKAKALQLRMLRSALERGPEELQTIFQEVLDLAPRQQKELAALLKETTLSSIIAAAKTVADRLKFVAALERIVFDHETKGRLKERSQLHRILAENTWMFGEEYNLWVSDGGLKRVLEKHKQYLDSSIVIDDPVSIVGKKRGIVDLMFSRTVMHHRPDDFEHMVVELKAPKVPIGSKETVQTKTYAMAVAGDERFHTVPGIKWHFWVVGNSYDKFTKAEIEGGPNRKRRLILELDNVSVGVKTWGELIDENKARLQFFQEQLQHNADEDASIAYIRERHSKLLEGVFVDEIVDAGEDDAAPDTVALAEADLN